MTIYEAIGYLIVILFTSLGVAVVGLLGYYGLYRAIERVPIGAKYEREAVAEILEVDKIKKWVGR